MLIRKENIIVEKSKTFADRIGRMCVFLQKYRKGNRDVMKQNTGWSAFTPVVL